MTLAGCAAPCGLEAQERVSFGTEDGGTLYADVYGRAARAVVLTHGGRAPEKLTLPKLIIVTRDDASGSGPRLPRIRADFEGMPEPKRMVVLEGSAHAQEMFQTADAKRVMDEILAFLSAGPARKYDRDSVEHGRLHLHTADREEIIVPPEAGQTGFDRVLVDQ